MKRKSILLVAMLIAFGGLYMGLRALGPDKSQPSGASGAVIYPERLIRPYSPMLGLPQAPVTIVEFFDPACEACRAFYPIVKDILRRYPQDVRLVLRYAMFHPGSDRLVRLLEASKRQNKYWQTLDALLATQPMWADHSRPNIELAYQAVEQAGLDLQQALTDAATSEMNDILRQEMQDTADLKIEKTPTFFVNSEGLETIGIEPLAALVAKKVAEARK